MNKKTMIFLLILFMFLCRYEQAFANCNYEEDSYHQTQQAACISASKKWDCELNRCMNKADAVDTREKSNACAEIEDTIQRKNCFDDLALEKSRTTNITDSSGGLQTIAYSTFGVSVGMTVMSYVASKSQTKCTSKTIFSLASAIFLLTEIYQYFFLKNKLEELQEEYEKKTVDDDSYNAQVEAFNYLKREQVEVKNVAERKFQIYTALTVIYGVAATVALYETIYPKNGCNISKNNLDTTKFFF